MPTKPLILLVDDIPQNTQVLGNILKDQGFSFAISTNSKDTFALLSDVLPDLILLDIMLPDEDGFSICKKLKASPKTAHIPIIFLSAKHDIKDKIRGFEMGAADYITKPFEDIEVTKRVNNHLQAKLNRDKLEKYNQELEEMVEQRTNELIIKERETILAQFLQGIIHNVRGPIASIANGLELTQMMTNDIQNRSSDKQTIFADLSEVCDINKLNTEKAKSLLVNLDALLRKSRNDYSEETEIFDLNKIIKQELNFLEVDLDFKNLVTKNISLSDEELIIKAIPAEISQIIQNLIKNALDALYNQKEKNITIISGINDQGCYFSISDNGPGIPKKHHQHIFDPFFTTKPKEKEKGSKAPTGTGIGLRFCKNTLEAYGGRISISEDFTTGAEFVVSLPLFNA